MKTHQDVDKIYDNLEKAKKSSKGEGAWEKASKNFKSDEYESLTSAVKARNAARSSGDKEAYAKAQSAINAAYGKKSAAPMKVASGSSFSKGQVDKLISQIKKNREGARKLALNKPKRYKEFLKAVKSNYPDRPKTYGKLASLLDDDRTEQLASATIIKSKESEADIQSRKPSEQVVKKAIKEKSFDPRSTRYWELSDEDLATLDI